MNVTIKISDQICRAARHRAIDAGSSLSGWVADLIRKELACSTSKGHGTLLEVLGSDKLSDADIDFPRDASLVRETDLS